MSEIFDQNCTDCPRLSAHLDAVKMDYPNYHCSPVASFGVDMPDLLIVGLAPGKHGANATGRPFTGDDSGVLLYQTLYKTGFASRPDSIGSDDGLQLFRTSITNAVKCLPPENKPVASEINKCNRFLAAELRSINSGAVVVALGSVAHKAILKALGEKLSTFKFGHGNIHSLQDLTLIDSYHCSRYNTQTKRLTPEMFEKIFEMARERINKN